ncbi:hypothetical protein [Streptomyces sp. NBC_00859]|uniref:hypothetical protein n=1 Tax=Streptomyces sp. NBC_00859 TaxID=2903682 RepID=UPI003866C60A|nr:hypothetical protein OG584_08030 [Streptomyces sp. NBC_00859]
MNRIIRGLGIGSAALACVVMSSSGASALETAHGKKYKGCTNYVAVWRSGGKVHAYSRQLCDKPILIQRPTVALSGNGGKTFVSAGKACSKARSCTTKTVSVKATKGWTYRGSNSGTGSQGSPKDSDYWPVSSVAHATYKYK